MSECISVKEKFPENDYYDRVVLERVRFGVEQALSRELIRATTDVFYDYTMDAIVAKIRAFVWGRELSVQEIGYPADWCEALKDRWLPRWAKRRWPIKKTTVILRAMAFYPTIKWDIQGHTATIAILRDVL